MPWTKALDERFADVPGVEVNSAKQDLLDNADDTSAQFKQLFGFVGAFSVIAGILLLVNIFVMLADERKSELGMLRAIGLKRNQLVRAFGMEGAVYSIVSAIARRGRRHRRGARRRDRGGEHLQSRRRLRRRTATSFRLTGPSLVLGFSIGAVISLVTVWGTSIWLGRLNVIRAIRDLPEPPANRRARVRDLCAFDR